MRRHGSHGGGMHAASSYTSGGDQNFGSSIFAEQPSPNKQAEREAAALRIQTIMRGNSARQVVVSKRESKMSDLARLEEAEKPVSHALDSAIAGEHAKRSLDNSKYLIDPRKSKFIGYWDVVTGLALVFTALVTPWEVAFAEPPKKFIESMFLFNRFVDSIFLVDMVLQFLLIYQVAAYGLV